MYISPTKESVLTQCERFDAVKKTLQKHLLNHEGAIRADIGAISRSSLDSSFKSAKRRAIQQSILIESLKKTSMSSNMPLSVINYLLRVS